MNDTIHSIKKLHPEDAIYKTKTFINELQIVQENYFTELLNELKLTKEGESWLFDYIYNHEDKEIDDFSHFLSMFNKKYEDMVENNN